MSPTSNLFSLPLWFFKSRCLSRKDYNRASNSWHWQVSSGNHVSKWSTACCSSPPSSLVSLTRCRLGTGTSIRLLPPTAQCRYRQLVPCSICMYVANFVPSLHWCSDTLLIVWITCTLLRYFRNYLFLMALCVFLQHCIQYTGTPINLKSCSKRPRNKLFTSTMISHGSPNGVNKHVIASIATLSAYISPTDNCNPNTSNDVIQQVYINPFLGGILVHDAVSWWPKV